MSNRKLKIGILTFHAVSNYGAVLQAYALMSYLRRQGHEVELIDYQPDYLMGRYQITAKALLHPISWVKWLKAVRFKGFNKKHLKVSSCRYASRDELFTAADVYDVVITGSDQVWNPEIAKPAMVDPAFFLDFVSEGKRRISYAASFGVDSISEEFHAEVRGLLGRMDAIAIREQSGKEIVCSLIGEDAAVEVVPDPTLLLESYDDLASKPSLEGYVFVYRVQTSELVEKVARAASDYAGVPLVKGFNTIRIWKEGAKVVLPDPKGWLGYIKHADVVVTNSFHGTIFSILFRKKFFTVSLTGKTAKRNARLLFLLEKLGLEDRFIREADLEGIDERLAEPINWDQVQERLTIWRASAYAYLSRNA
jgi:hypothetical protein